MRPLCGVVTDQDACNQSSGCYWNEGTCTYIDAAFCTTQYAQQDIQSCRKDGNDYCYYDDATKRCTTCNTDASADALPLKLISVDGKRCEDYQPGGCGGLGGYLQGTHAACRKYCEPFQHANQASHECELCPDGKLAFDNRCVTRELCNSVHNGGSDSVNGMYLEYAGIRTAGTVRSCQEKKAGLSQSNVLIGIQNDRYIEYSEQNYEQSGD